MPYITVFTPTYNRVETLRRLYESLKRQRCSDFEWVIVDDGSTKDVKSEIDSLIIDGQDFPVRFYRIEHGGKHRAVNKGLDVANGKLFYMLDSDDWLTDDALCTIIELEKLIPQSRKCAGLCTQMISGSNELIGTDLKQALIFMPLTEMMRRGINGDHTDILFTEVFRQYRYPEIENEWHLAPGVPFVRMANNGYNMIFLNKATTFVEYRSDGLSALGDKKSLCNFSGYTLRTKELIQSNVGCKRKTQLLVKYAYIALLKEQTIKQISSSLDITELKALFISIIARVYSLVKKGGSNY